STAGILPAARRRRAKPLPKLSRTSATRWFESSVVLATDGRPARLVFSPMVILLLAGRARCRVWIQLERIGTTRNGWCCVRKDRSPARRVDNGCRGIRNADAIGPSPKFKGRVYRKQHDFTPPAGAGARHDAGAGARGAGRGVRALRRGGAEIGRASCRERV